MAGIANKFNVFVPQSATLVLRRSGDSFTMAWEFANTRTWWQKSGTSVLPKICNSKPSLWVQAVASTTSNVNNQVPPCHHAHCTAPMCNQIATQCPIPVLSDLTWDLSYLRPLIPPKRVNSVSEKIVVGSYLRPISLTPNNAPYHPI